MKTLIIALAGAFTAIAPAAAQTTQRFNATKANDYGVAYTLPNTAIDITIEAEITRRQPGEFAKYASKYLNVADPVMDASSTVKLKSVTINTSPVPDTEERYLITLKSGNAPYIIVAPDNTPLAINTDKLFEAERLPIPVAQAPSPTPLETEAARHVVTQDMLRSHSSAKRAELAADQIYALRQSRTDLITGQADQMPPDGQAMQLVLDNINAQEKALEAMFVGTVSTYTCVETVQVVPQADEDEIASLVIARLSPLDGIVGPDNLSGAPVTFSLHVESRGETPVNEKGEELPFPKGGVAYRIPGTAIVTVSYDGRPVISKTLSLAQYGVVYGMNPSSFTDKKAPVYLLFDPATGAAAATGPATL